MVEIEQSITQIGVSVKYYAKWFLALLTRIDNIFEQWIFGTALESLYHLFKAYLAFIPKPMWLVILPCLGLLLLFLFVLVIENLRKLKAKKLQARRAQRLAENTYPINNPNEQKNAAQPMISHERIAGWLTPPTESAKSAKLGSVSARTIESWINKSTLPDVQALKTSPQFDIPKSGIANHLVQGWFTTHLSNSTLRVTQEQGATIKLTENIVNSWYKKASHSSASNVSTAATLTPQNSSLENTQSQVQVTDRAQPRPAPVVAPQPVPSAAPQVPVSQPQVQVQTQPRPAPVVAPQPVPSAAPQVPVSQPQVQVQTQPRPAPVVAPQPVPSAAPQVPVSQPQVQVQTQPRPAPVVAPQPVPSVAPQAPVSQPQVQVQTQPRPAPVVAPQPVPSVAPQAPVSQPQVQVQTQPRPAPVVAPQPVPSVAPQAPVSQPQVQVQTQPRPAPVVTPQTAIPATTQVLAPQPKIETQSEPVLEAGRQAQIHNIDSMPHNALQTETTSVSNLQGDTVSTVAAGPNKLQQALKGLTAHNLDLRKSSSSLFPQKNALPNSEISDSSHAFSNPANTTLNTSGSQVNLTSVEDLGKHANVHGEANHAIDRLNVNNLLEQYAEKTMAKSNRKKINYKLFNERSLLMQWMASVQPEELLEHAQEAQRAEQFDVAHHILNEVLLRGSAVECDKALDMRHTWAKQSVPQVTAQPMTVQLSPNPTSGSVPNGGR